MAGPEGLEPPASRLEAASSIHLSYGPKYSVSSDESRSWPGELDLPISAANQPEHVCLPHAFGDFVSQPVVYSVCLRAENSKNVYLVEIDESIVENRGVNSKAGREVLPALLVLSFESVLVAS
jgi:hypothetical protein